LLLSIIKNETFSQEEKRVVKEKEGNARKKGTGHLFSLPDLQHALRVAPNDSCGVISLLVDVTVLLMQAEKSVYLVHVAEIMYLVNCPASCCYCTPAARK
jgi:hypothetical protein